MTQVHPPTEYTGTAPCVFLAGGITGCGDWQREVVGLLAGTGLVALNPRRPDFPIGDPAAAAEQIRWEFRHLLRATARLFWFPAATLCPIALYELGAWSVRPGPLFVGVDPDYARRVDVVVQTGLARPDVRVVHSIPDLVAGVLTWREAHDAGANGSTV